MREVIVIALDVLGLLLVAAGLAAFLWLWMGAAALAPAGVLLLCASQFADRQATASTRRRAVNR